MKIVRIITDSHYIAHTAELFKNTAAILQIQDVDKFMVGCFMFQEMRGNCDSYRVEHELKYILGQTLPHGQISKG